MSLKGKKDIFKDNSLSSSPEYRQFLESNLTIYGEPSRKKSILPYIIGASLIAGSWLSPPGQELISDILSEKYSSSIEYKSDPESSIVKINHPKYGNCRVNMRDYQVHDGEILNDVVGYSAKNLEKLSFQQTRRIIKDVNNIENSIIYAGEKYRIPFGMDCYSSYN